MKRVFEHPPESLTGKRYWRSVGELSDTPEFRGWLEREFPSGAAQMEGDEWSRRSFLKFMGASMALAGFGLTSCRRPEAHLVPFTKSAEWAIPGKPLFYATAMPRRNGALPLVVTTHRWPADQDRWQSAPSREWRRHRRFTRKLLFSISTIRRARNISCNKGKGTRSRDVSKNIWANCARKLRPMAAPGSPFSLKKRIRQRVNVCARNWKRFSRKCAGAFTIRC